MLVNAHEGPAPPPPRAAAAAVLRGRSSRMRSLSTARQALPCAQQTATLHKWAARATAGAEKGTDGRLRRLAPQANHRTHEEGSGLLCREGIPGRAPFPQ